MTLQRIQRPIVTIFIGDFNIFTLADHEIIKQVIKELTITFNILNIRSLAFYISLKLICN